MARPEVTPYHVVLHLAQLLEESVVLLEALLGGLEHRLRLLHFGPTFFTSCLKREWGGWAGEVPRPARGEMRRARFARAEGVGLPGGEARAAKRLQEAERG